MVAGQDSWRSRKNEHSAGYGIFYSVIEGNTIAIDEPQPPYGLSYTSPESPLFTTPFIGAADRNRARKSVSTNVSGLRLFHHPAQYKH